MLDLPAVHALARLRRPRLAVEQVLAEAAGVAREEGLVGDLTLLDRLEVLTRWHHGDVDAAVVDQRPPEEGAYGWVMLLTGRTRRQGGGDATTLTVVTDPAALPAAARLVARLRVEPRAVALLGGDEGAARRAGVPVKALAEGDALPAHVTLAYGRERGEAGVVEQLLWRGANPLALVRLDADRPLVVATGDPVEAVAFAAALTPGEPSDEASSG